MMTDKNNSVTPFVFFLTTDKKLDNNDSTSQTKILFIGR